MVSTIVDICLARNLPAISESGFIPEFKQFLMFDSVYFLTVLFGILTPQAGLFNTRFPNLANEQHIKASFLTAYFPKIIINTVNQKTLLSVTNTKTKKGRSIERPF